MRLIDKLEPRFTGEWGNEPNSTSSVPVLRTTNFKNDGSISFENVVYRDITLTDKNRKKLLQKNDILIEKSGGSDKQPVGRVVLFNGENNKYFNNNFTSCLRVKKTSNLNPKYVFYLLKYRYDSGTTKRFQNKTTGLHNLQLESYLNSITVPDYSNSDQNLIVQKLDLIEKLLRKLLSQKDKLDLFVKSRNIDQVNISLELLYV